jgi:hypothetical protein
MSFNIWSLILQDERNGINQCAEYSEMFIGRIDEHPTRMSSFWYSLYPIQAVTRGFQSLSACLRTIIPADQSHYPQMGHVLAQGGVTRAVLSKPTIFPIISEAPSIKYKTKSLCVVLWKPTGVGLTSRQNLIDRRYPHKPLWPWLSCELNPLTETTLTFFLKDYYCLSGGAQLSPRQPLHSNDGFPMSINLDAELIRVRFIQRSKS